MLLTLSCFAANAPDFGYLLHKNPANVYRSEAWFGGIAVFYPRVEPNHCAASLLLTVDPIGLVRGRGAAGLDQYVNDRPYVASSLMSVALIDAFSTAMNGRSKERPERVSERMPLRAELPAVNCAGGEEMIRRLFEPLGYVVAANRLPLDVRFPAWGDSSVYALQLDGTQTVQDLLTHLYVLLPVLDNAKHYYVGSDEIDKLLKKGERWLPAHPERDLITRRYLNYRQAFVREATERLRELREDAPETQEERDAQNEREEAQAEEPMRLNDARMQAALEAVRELNPPATRVLDLGCGEGRLLQLLQRERSLRRIVGADVSSFALERAARRLKLENLPEREQERLQLIQASLVYRDDRFQEFDVALLIEVIEHLDPPRLATFERVVFHHARPRRVVVSTPNAEYNVRWASLPAGRFRHRDHRFEWTRAAFQAWAERVAAAEGYAVALRGVGQEDAEVGCPTQMAVFDQR